MMDQWDWDPDYPIDNGNEDGLDPESRKILDDIKRKQESENDNYEVPDLPY